MTDAEKIKFGAEAHGSMAALYQAARTRFEYSDVLEQEKGATPPAIEQLRWLKAMIESLQRHHADYVFQRQWWLAIQTRRRLGVVIEELGALLKETKEGEGL